MDKILKIQYFSYFSLNFPSNFNDLKMLCQDNKIDYNDEKHIFIYNEKKKIEDENSYQEIYQNPDKNINIFRMIEKDKFKEKKFEKSEQIILSFFGNEKKINYIEEIPQLKRKMNNLEELEKLIKNKIQSLINKLEINKKYLLQLEKIIKEKEKTINETIDNKENGNMIQDNDLVNNEKKEKEYSIEKKMVINRDNQIKKEYVKLKKLYDELKSVNVKKELKKQKELMKENEEIIKENKQLTEDKNRIMNNIIKTFYDKRLNYKNQIKDIQKEYVNKINNSFIHLEDEMKKIFLEKMQQKFNQYLIKFDNDYKIREVNLIKYEEEYKNIKDEFNNIISSNNFDHKINCNKCKNNIIGIRYECGECQFNLCEKCELKNYLYKTHPHKFYKIRKIKNQNLIEINSKDIIEENINEKIETNI